MCRLFVAAVFMVVTVLSHRSPPTVEEVKAQLTAAGISNEAADGIIAIGEKHKEEFEAAKSDRKAAMAAFEVVKAEVDAYIKTQSEADQTAYNAYIEKKKAEFEQFKNSAPEGLAQ